MNKGYAVFCDADRQFYDAPHRLPVTGKGSAGLYETLRQELPDGWQRHRSGDWLAFRPLDRELPNQGWKIHVSACLDNAEQVLDRVWDYCVPRAIAFKFMPSRYLLHTRNAKYADRGGQREVRHRLPGRRGAVPRHRRGPGRAARRRAGPVHPQRSALGRRAGVRALRQLHRAALLRRRG